MARRLLQLVVAQGDPTQPLGAGAQHLTAERGRHQVRFTRRRFHCRGKFLSRAIDPGEIRGGFQACDGGEHAERRGHWLGYDVLRALGHARRPSFDGLIQLGDSGLKLARCPAWPRRPRRRNSLSGSTTASVLPADSQPGRPPGTARTLRIRDARPGHQFDAIEIRLRLEGDGQLAVAGSEDERRGQDCERASLHTELFCTWYADVRKITQTPPYLVKMVASTFMPGRSTRPLVWSIRILTGMR